MTELFDLANTNKGDLNSKDKTQVSIYLSIYIYIYLSVATAIVLNLFAT